MGKPNVNAKNGNTAGPQEYSVSTFPHYAFAILTHEDKSVMELSLSCYFLASDESSYVTGIELFVDVGAVRSEVRAGMDCVRQ